MFDADWIQAFSVISSFAFMWLGVFMLVRRAMRRRQPAVIAPEQRLLTNSEGVTIAAIAAQLAAVNRQRIADDAQRREDSRRREERLAAVQRLFQGVPKPGVDVDELFGASPVSSEASELSIEGEWADMVTTPRASRPISPSLPVTKLRRARTYVTKKIESAGIVMKSAPRNAPQRRRVVMPLEAPRFTPMPGMPPRADSSSGSILAMT